MSLSVRELTAEEHLAYVATRPSVSFMQLPSWGQTKAEWRAHSLGWVDDDVRAYADGEPR